MCEFRSITKNSETSFIINKSKFISHSKYVETELEAQDFIEQINSLYHDATHNCSCYIIGQEKLVQRFNDDGEPSGTAGLPMLEVCKLKDITNICVVVTRYFGGVKLGAGGLVRAYSKAASDVIDASGTSIWRPFFNIEVVIDYHYLGALQNHFKNKKYHIINQDYLEQVEINLYIEKSEIENFEREVNNFTNGDANIHIEGEKLLPTKNNELI